MKPMIKSRPLVVPFEEGWKAILESAALEVFELMANVRLEPNPTSVEEPHGEQTAMVGMAGALCGMTTLRCSRGTAGKLATLMLGEASTPSTSRDALGELCNMIAGNFKSKVDNLADHCMLSVPTVITGDNYSMEMVEPSLGVTVALKFEGESVFVTLSSTG